MLVPNCQKLLQGTRSILAGAAISSVAFASGPHSGLAQLPGGLGGTPGIPSVPNLPNAPQIPNTPRVRPNLSDIPRVPNAGRTINRARNVASSATRNVGESVPLKLSGQSATKVAQDGNLGMNLNTTGNRVVISGLDSEAFAANAGFQAGDEILAVNESWVHSYDDLSSQLQAAAEGAGEAWVYISRNGTKQWVNLDFTGQSRPKMGVNMREVNGVVTLTNVTAGSAAAEAGLQSRDQVLSINANAIKATADLASQVQAAAQTDGSLQVTIVRDGMNDYVAARLADLNTIDVSANADATERFGTSLATSQGNPAGARTRSVSCISTAIVSTPGTQSDRLMLHIQLLQSA